MVTSIQHAAAAYATTAKGAIPTDGLPLAKPQGVSKALQPSFPELLGVAVDKAISAGYTGESQSAAALAKKTQLHEMVTAVANAELTLQTVVAIRDKVINAYNEIMRMPI